MLGGLMPFRQVLRSRASVLAVFLVTAAVASSALGWLVWQLLQQDEAVEEQRAQERLEQVADGAAARMKSALLDLEALAARPATPPQPLPPGVSLVSFDETGVTVHPPGTVLFVPASRARVSEAPDQLFLEGERLEFVGRDLRAALARYEALAQSPDPSVRASALARGARVHRNLGARDHAIAAYDQLGAIEATTGGLPAGLVARIGRASMFEKAGDAAGLRREADALRQELATGCWTLVKSEYDYYHAEAHRWLGIAQTENRDARLRSEALEWAYEQRRLLEPVSRRAIALPHGPAFAAWTATSGGFRAVVAASDFMQTLVADAVPQGFDPTLLDLEGRLLLGPPPQARAATVRMGGAAGLPWTLHLSTVLGAGATASSARRQLLWSLCALVALVMVAGGYVIARAVTREQRVASLQSDFVAAVSHEFRSPLTSMYQIAQMLASDRFVSEEARRQSYGVLVSETERLRRLVENLLDFGRFERADAFTFERVDAAALVRATVDAFQERVGQEGYEVLLSGAACEVSVHADREALARALWNLLDNAVKYSPACKTVWVDFEHDDGRVRLAIRDRGLGIPVPEQAHIFDRFVRGAESKAQRIKGTGIGLAMVRQIVQAHGGEICVTSEPGHGSCFTLVLQTAGGPG